VAFNNSDITANARQGRGGQVRLATQGIFGTAFRSRLTPNSDITATSNLGAEFEGIVEIQTPDLDTSSGLTRLSEQVYGAIPAWTNSCAQFANSQFILSSRHQARSESFNLSLPFHFPLQVVVPSAAALSMEHEQGVDLALESAVDHGIDRESNQLTYQTPDQGSNQQKINEATHWSQSTNGTIQLYQSAIDAPSVEPIGCRS